jgi:PKD repeat protein
LKTNKQDKVIAKLFRKKLENAKIVPDASVKSELMRKLARKEFLRFNPSGFNIYYFGAVLVSAITIALIIKVSPEKPDQSLPLSVSVEKSIENAIVSNGSDTIKKSVSLNDKNLAPLLNKPIILGGDVPVEEPVSNIGSRENNIVTHAGVNVSFNEKRLFSEAAVKNNELKGGFKTNKVLFEVSASEGCTPLKIRFYNKSDSFDSCRWAFGDGGYSNEKNPEWIFDVEGDYKVVLSLFRSDSLHETSAANISVYPKPVALFEIASGKTVLPEDEIRFFNYSTNAAHYYWNFGDGITSDLFEPTHRYKKSGNYNVRLVVSSDYGCSDSLIVMNPFSASEYFIDFPNAFIPDPQGPTGGYYSPKSDESARVFHPVFSGVSDYQLKIFSKLGILIFESNDINIGWDGYINGQMSIPGVYIWKVRGNFRNGEPFIKIGDLTLLKKL